MRISNRMMTTTVTDNLFKRSESLLKKQEIVSSQKKINRPSDDPMGMGKILDYRKTLASIEQYNRNIDAAKTHISLSETIYEQMGNLLNTAKQIASDQISGSGDAASRQTRANQIDQIRDQVFQLANSKVGDEYMFAGRKTDTTPFTMDGSGNVSYAGDATASSGKRVIVGENLDVTIKANGQEIFMGTEDTFAILKDLKDELLNTTPDESVLTDRKNRLQLAIDQLEIIRADGASVYNRLEVTENRLDKLKQNVENMLGETENADLAKAIVELQAEETAYQVALQTTSKIITKTLADYI
jgi:flagellar hook-associated protein 3 FlgL